MTEERLKLFSWYHGALSREEANVFLEGQRPGLFLLRKRKEAEAEYVLSVSDSKKVMHYIILDVNGMYFKIGEQRFADIPSIIEFYKRHLLDSTTLTEPVIRPGVELDPQLVLNNLANLDLCKVKALFNFPGKDSEDLPFKKGDSLTVIRKDEEKWWLARDSAGREGMIPSTYVEIVSSPGSSSPRSPKSVASKVVPSTALHNYSKPKDIPNFAQIPADRVGPVFAIAIQNREPNFYDKSHLRFKKGDRIEVLQMNEDGSWFGRLVSTNQTGFFPFTHVELVK